MTYYKRIALFLLLSFIALALAKAEAPTGYYYLTKGKTKAELKTTLKEISSPLYLLNYGSGENATWQGFYLTDRNEADNSVVDMYSPIKRYFSGYNSVSGIDIEHSFPKSWWGGHVNYAYRDLHHLFPSDSRTNSAKNNFPLGEIGSTVVYYNELSTIGDNIFGKEYKTRAFEPADEFKGDFARAYFYISSIHEDLYPLWNSPMLNNELYPMWKSWAKDLLLTWHRQDPVSDKERTRNEKVFSIQGNRNPFIDYPELAEHIWGNATETPFNYDEKEEAFLIFPTRNYHLNMGAVMQGAEKSNSFTLQGVNISSEINISFASNNSIFSLSKQTISAQETLQGIEISVTALATRPGIFNDTIIIRGGGLKTETHIPINVVVSPEFLVLEPTNITPVGGIIHWFEDSLAEDYELSVYTGTKQAGDIIISGYYEGASNDKAIEIFNGTGNTVDLSHYQLKKQTNGMGSYVANLRLSGQLEHNGTYLIVYSRCTNESIREKANVFTDSVIAFNGNDAVALFRNEVKIDIVGEKDGGADYYWGLDKILKRKPQVTHPASEFNEEEWEEYSYSDKDRLNNHSMQLDADVSYIFKNLSVGKVNKIELKDLTPQTRYYYTVKSKRTGEVINSENSAQLFTSALDTPVALEASDITANSFTATWEDHPYTQAFRFDLLKLVGEIQEELETFDNVGSLGQNLPEEWAGTVSGNYTSNVSSGNTPPSVGFKRDKEWLQTKAFNHAITHLQFMYRFPSNASGSYFTLEGSSKDKWLIIDTIHYQNSTKQLPSYSFDTADNFKQFRFTYYKSQGNLAIDDVYIEYGSIDTTFVYKDLPVAGHSFELSKLPTNSDYFYRVAAHLHGISSDYSNLIHVALLYGTGIEVPSQSTFKIAHNDDYIFLFNLQQGDLIRLYSLDGKLLHQTISESTIHTIPMQQRGIFLIQVGNEEAIKLIKTSGQ